MAVELCATRPFAICSEGKCVPDKHSVC